MNLRKEPFILTTKEVDWLAKALSTDSYRLILTVGCLAYYKGSAVLVATDTHRLHVLRLGPVEAEFKSATVDFRRILFEARFAKANQVKIESDLSAVLVEKTAPRSGKVETSTRIHAPVLDTVVGPYPNFGRVIPDTKRPVAELFSLNSKYLTEATLLSSNGAFRITMVSENASSKPIMFIPGEGPENGRWLSVVMPMASEKWVVDANDEAKEGL
ncbi:MAG: hypothetical protein ABL984_00485 [Pyrinomonadaceae bacterium]